MTIQRISFLDTLKEILIFTSIYAIAGGIQLLVMIAIAIVLGNLCAPVFITLAMLLDFTPHALVDVRPFRVGLYIQHTWHNRKKPGHVALAQFLLGIVGIGATIVLLAGYMPTMWPWRAEWFLESRWPWAQQWHALGANEIVMRGLLLLAVPFIGWPSALILKWSARMEVIRPSFRETMHGRVDPSTGEGPGGEQYKRDAGKDNDDEGVVVIPPDYD